MYRIVINPSAEKQILKLPKDIRIRIADGISNLAHEPRPINCKKLKGRNAYRIRVGDYRIVYEIRDDILLATVIAAGNRKDIYK